MFSFLVNYLADNFNVSGYHAVNLFLHILNGILLYFILYKTLNLPLFKESAGVIYEKKIIIAALASLIFVSHPIQTESVTYIISRSELLVTCFYLTALLLFINYYAGAEPVCAPGRHIPGKKIFVYTALFLSAFLASGSKEITVTLPAIAILYDFCFLSRGSVKKIIENRLIPHLILIVNSFFIFYNFFFLIPQVESAGFSVKIITPLQYLFTQFNVFWTYVRLLIVPINQNLDYDYRVVYSVFELPAFVSMAGIILILSVTSYFLIRSNKKQAGKEYPNRLVFAFSVMWFFITLLPTSSFIPLSDVIFEHRLYLPSIGFCIILSLCIVLLTGGKTRFFIPIAVIIISIYSFAAFERNKIWQSDIKLWQDVAEKSPNKYRAHKYLGLAFQKEAGDHVKAIAEYQKVIALQPDDFEAYNNTGLAYMRTGRFDEAVNYFLKAAELKPAIPQPYINLSGIYNITGEHEKELDALLKAINISPYNAGAHYLLGNFYVRENILDKALSEFQKTAEIEPRHSMAHNNIGNIYMVHKDFSMAIEEYKKAVNANPHNAEALYNMGNALEQTGNLKEAKIYYEKFIEMAPYEYSFQVEELKDHLKKF
jgi:tetratricopeptide (TPR) repeat protein